MRNRVTVSCADYRDRRTCEEKVRALVLELERMEAPQIAEWGRRVAVRERQLRAKRAA